MNWYYIDGPRRVGPLNETEWAELLRTSAITPETLVWHEGMEKWTPYKLVSPPEEQEAESPDFMDAVSQEPVETPEAFAARVVDLDYPVQLEGCISRAWNVWKSPFFVPLVGATLTLAVFSGLVTKAAGALNIVEIMLLVVVQGILVGGLYNLFLRCMRGMPVSIAALFSGFQPAFLKPLALQAMVSYLVTQLCLLPLVIAITMLGFDATNVDQASITARLQSDPNAFLVLLLVLLTCLIPAIYFAFCWMFAVPLIVDKRMNFWPAMQLSRRKVLQHPWRISVVSVVAGILGIAGVVGFLICVFLTLPLYFLVMLYLYEDMFNEPRKPGTPQTD